MNPTLQLYRLFVAATLMGLFGATAYGQELIQPGASPPASFVRISLPGLDFPTGEVFEGLTRIGRDGKVYPAAALRWTATPDHMAYIFELDPSAKWSDGTQVTSEDFIYGICRGVSYVPSEDPNVSRFTVAAPAKKCLEGNREHLQALSPQLLKITLPASELNFPLRAAMMAEGGWLNPLPVHRAAEIEGKVWKIEDMVFSGPFRLVQWVRNARTVLARWPQFHEANDIKIQGLVMIPIEDLRERFRRYRLGELDIAPRMLARELNPQRERLRDELHIAIPNLLIFLRLNLNSEKWASDQKARQALSLAIDRQALETVLDGQVTAFDGAVPNRNFAYTNAKATFWRDNQGDREIAAKKLWEGVKERPVKITLAVEVDEMLKRIVLAIGSAWKRVLGVELVLDVVSPENFNTRLAALDYTATILIQGGVGAFDFLERHGVASARPKRVSDLESFGAVLDRARSAQSAPEQNGFLAQAEKMVLDFGTIIPVAVPNAFILVKPRVKGDLFNYMDGRNIPRNFEIAN